MIYGMKSVQYVAHLVCIAKEVFAFADHTTPKLLMFPAFL